MKRSMMMFAALAAATVGTATFAETADAKKVKATRGQVLKSCKANGGTGWGGGGGTYGCVTKGGWVACDAHGDCNGGRNDRKAYKGRTSTLPGRTR